MNPICLVGGEGTSGLLCAQSAARVHPPRRACRFNWRSRTACCAPGFGQLSEAFYGFSSPREKPTRRQEKEPDDQEAFERVYSIGESIGKGHFGQVFACRARSLVDDRRSLCVKKVQVGSNLPRKDSTNFPETEKLELLRVLQAMDHPNLVKYYEFIETSDALYTVMLRCDGPALDDYVESQGNHLRVDDARRVGLQVLSALAAVHVLGIMHRDVKPSNFCFLEVETETLQLLDFGFAKQASTAPAQHSATGTLVYAAPEVFDGVYAHKCDMWSAGVVLFELLSGQAPFDSADVSILRSLHRDPVLMGSSLFSRGACWREVPAVAKDLVRGLLTVDTTVRLCAEQAISHPWFGDDADCIDLPMRRLSCPSSCSSLRRFSEGAPIAEMKRSQFVWNMAEASSTASGSESDLDEMEAAPRRSRSTSS